MHNFTTILHKQVRYSNMDIVYSSITSSVHKKYVHDCDKLKSMLIFWIFTFGYFMVEKKSFKKAISLKKNKPGLVVVFKKNRNFTCMVLFVFNLVLFLSQLGHHGSVDQLFLLIHWFVCSSNLGQFLFDKCV